MEDTRRGNQDFLELFKKELAGKVQILERGLSQLEYEYARENAELLINTVRAIKQGAYHASFSILVELSQAMEDVFSCIKDEEHILAPSQVDCLFQADAVFRSVLRQENKNVSAWLIEREFYIRRVIKVLWGFLEEKGITPSVYQGKTDDGRDGYEPAGEEIRDDAAGEKEELAEPVVAAPSAEPRKEPLPRRPLYDASTVTPEPVLQEEPEADEEMITPEEESEADEKTEEDLPAEETAGTKFIPEINDGENALCPESLLRLASECLVQSRRFRRQYPVFAETKGDDDTAPEGITAYYSVRGVRRHLEYLTEQLCEEVLRQNRVPLGRMTHQLSQKISQLTAAWDKKIDFVSEGDGVLLDARILTGLNDVLWPFLHAVFIDSADGKGDGGKKNAAISSLRLTGEEKMEMAGISLFIGNYRLHESWAAQQSNGLSAEKQRVVQSKRDALSERVTSSGGAIDYVISEEGTKIIMQLPVSFATFPCLPVQIQGASYALPLARVERSFDSARDILSKTNRGYEIVHEGDRILCIAGEEIFPSPETDDRHDEDKAVVILKDGKMKYGFIVDTTAENEPFVLYPLDQRLGPIRGVLGTAMTADGSPTLIVDADALFAIVKNKTP